MTLLLLFKQASSGGSGGSRNSLAPSFVEANMLLGTFEVDDFLSFAAVTHNDAGAVADADAVPAYAIYNDETSALIASGNMAKLTTGTYTARLQLTTLAGFATSAAYTVRVAAVMGLVPAVAVHAFQTTPPAVNVTLWKDATAPAMTGDAFARLGAPAGASVSADIAAIAAASAAGSGAISFPVTINDASSNPIDGVEVWISTDSAGASVVAGTLSTDALGVVTFMLDAGTYYLWRQRSGYNFANPVTIVVS